MRIKSSHKSTIHHVMLKTFCNIVSWKIVSSTNHWSYNKHLWYCGTSPKNLHDQNRRFGLISISLPILSLSHCYGMTCINSLFSTIIYFKTSTAQHKRKPVKKNTIDHSDQPGFEPGTFPNIGSNP